MKRPGIILSQVGCDAYPGDSADAGAELLRAIRGCQSHHPEHLGLSSEWTGYEPSGELFKQNFEDSFRSALVSNLPTWRERADFESAASVPISMRSEHLPSRQNRGMVQFAFQSPFAFLRGMTALVPSREVFVTMPF